MNELIAAKILLFAYGSMAQSEDGQGAWPDDSSEQTQKGPFNFWSSGRR